jgi:hypothetical protein
MDASPDFSEMNRIASTPVRLQSDWQPIETAPKEHGKVILGCVDVTGSVYPMFWNERLPHLPVFGPGFWWTLELHTKEESLKLASVSFLPTHWMPLPSAPRV